MAIIDKIRLSGTTYDIVDQSKAKVIEVTQQQYDAIVTPEANAIYVITDAPAIDISDFYNKATINGMMALKQDTLVSGTNIKTINNESILGSGNITIQGGQTDASLDVSSNNPVANSAITTALNTKADGMDVDAVSSPTKSLKYRLKRGTTILAQPQITLGSNLVYGSEGNTTLSVSGVVETSAITTAMTSGSTNSEVPSAKAVYDALQGKQDTLTAGNGITINGNVISANGGGGSITIDPTLDSGSTNAVANSAVTAAIGAVKAYYIDFGVLTTQGIHDADWDGMVAAINAHRPIYASLGAEYYSSECLIVGADTIKMVASNNVVHFFYTFTKNGSEDYSFAYETRPYTTDAEKAAWNAKADVSAVTAVSDALSGKADVSAVTAVSDALSGKVNTSAVTSSVTSSSTDVVTSGGVYAQLDGIKLRKVTESQWSTISGSTDASTLYVVIPDPNQA